MSAKKLYYRAKQPPHVVIAEAFPSNVLCCQSHARSALITLEAHQGSSSVKASPFDDSQFHFARECNLLVRSKD